MQFLCCFEVDSGKESLFRKYRTIGAVNPTEHIRALGRKHASTLKLKLHRNISHWDSKIHHPRLSHLSPHENVNKLRKNANSIIRNFTLPKKSFFDKTTRSDRSTAVKRCQPSHPAVLQLSFSCAAATCLCLLARLSFSTFPIKL